MRLSASGISSSDPSLLKTCATGNPDRVPGGISTRCVRALMGSDIGAGGPWTSTNPCSSTALQRYRDTDAAKTFLSRLLGEYDVPEGIHTDQLRSYGVAIREIPSLVNVDHQHVISTARWNNIIEQSHRSTRR